MASLSSSCDGKASWSQPNDGASNVIQMSSIEPVKENLQPLRVGRSVAALQTFIAAADATPRHNDEVIRAKRDHFENAIRNYTGEDALNPWLNYIVWIQQTFATGGKNAHLLELLEQCTRTFKDSETHRNNIRYVKVWLLLADQCRDATEVFTWMDHHHIGITHALLYEAWSLWHETNTRYADGERVLQLGLDRAAQPRAKLVTALKRYQDRGAKRVTQMMADAARPQSSSSLVAAAKVEVRAPLAPLSDRSHTTAPAAPTNGVTVRLSNTIATAAPTVPVAAPRTSLSQMVAPSSSSSSSSRANFTIFSDDAARAPSSSSGRSLSAAVTAPSSLSNVRVYTDLPTRTTMSKENVGVPTTWNAGTTLQYGGLKSSLGTPVTVSQGRPVTVFMDDDCRAARAPSLLAGVPCHMPLRVFMDTQPSTPSSSTMFSSLTMTASTSASAPSTSSQ